jgi:tRNA uridine 5-carboxymethylaminomethyl modification enzyme
MKVDLIVVGGGHAGVEAAHIAAKLKLRVLLITSHLDMIGQMSCNPAIGGVAKGNIVREIDALGGLMGEAADATGIHFRMLNRSKGMAVWGNRAQADKRLYRTFVRGRLETQPTLALLQGMVKRLAISGGRATGVVMDSGEEIRAEAVILAMGTFLNGLGHIGLNSFPCGRLGEPPSGGLTESITSLGIASGRLKTGTSPRIDGRTISYSSLEEQPGDDPPWPFAYSGKYRPKNRLSCWIGRSNEKTHEIIRSNLDRSPLYTGKIKSLGPRYCPSIEDKVVRFGDRGSHTLFLEPEGLDTSEVYLNGMSTSLPFDVQQQLVNSIEGLETAQILRPGYGIEYDYFQPLQLQHTLESKVVRRLYFAGQINGTSGYEEAACQGLVAGVNASEEIRGGQPLILGRETSYTGVLIDDLVTKGTEEPYRMFTSRAEYRLLLRQDNCDERLMAGAWERGMVDRETFDARRRVWDAKKAAIRRLEETSVSPEQWERASDEELSQTVHAIDLLRRPSVTLGQVELAIGTVETADDELRASLEADVKYSGFVEKQKKEIQRLRQLENAVLPAGLDYNQVMGLLTESRAKLSKIQPGNLGQAARIPGVTPADVSVLMAHLAGRMRNDVSRETEEGT